MSGCTDYQKILVFDVSRWGRFQDADESAYYEFLCKRSGVHVEYCSELFRNDGSITTTIIKNMKRAMAGEYSRDLSAKVSVGKRRLAELGFRVSGASGYGLRRTLIDRTGNLRMTLQAGERKGISTDRIVLTRGPDHEVKTVRRIFDLLIDHNLTCRQIAELLNTEGIVAHTGRPWRRQLVAALLRNPKYMGTHRYGRNSRFLSDVKHKTPAATWIDIPNAFEAIISTDRFEQAQHKLDDWHTPYSSNELLDYLTALWCAKGELSLRIISKQSNFPTNPTIRHKFGSFSKCLTLLGYRRFERRIKNVRLRDEILETLCEEIGKRGGSAKFLPRREHVSVNGELIVGLCFGLNLRSPNFRRCQFGIKSHRRADVIIVPRLDDKADILDYYVLPFMFALNTDNFIMSGRSYERFQAFRHDTLTPFYDLCGRLSLGVNDATKARSA